MDETVLFRVGPLTLERSGRCVLEHAGLVVEPGRVVALLGANGAGKSSLLAAMAHDLPARSTVRGQAAITLNGQPLDRLGSARQARQRAVLTQRPQLNFDLLVSEVVAMGAYPFPELAVESRGPLMARCLELAGAAHLEPRRYTGLSGGEQQRVQFARVLLQLLAGLECADSPRYLLLDEPTSSLDPRASQIVLRAACRLTREHPVGVLVVLHDINLATLWADQLVVLHDGCVLASGTPSDVVRPDLLERVYGMQAHVISHPQHPERPLVVFGRD